MKPYLRVANVFEDRIDATDLKEMDFTGNFERFKLHPGDVLLNEGQTPQLLGRPAIYRGIPEDVAFTNSLLRFKAGPDVLPEWALTVFRHYMRSGRFTRESRITTNIAHLSATRFKSVEFPIPPLEEQRRIVELLEGHLSHLDAAVQLLSDTSARAQKMLAAARESLWQNATVFQRIGDLGAVTTGRTPPTRSSGLFGDAVPFVTPGDVREGDQVVDAQRGLSKAGITHARVVGSGSVLVVCIGATIGKVGWTDRPCAFNQQINAVQLDTPSQAEVYAAMLAAPSFQRRMRESASATTMPLLNKTAFSSLEVPVIADDAMTEVADHLRGIREDVMRVQFACGAAAKRADRLQQTLLAAASWGRLTIRAHEVSDAHRMANT